MMIEEIVILGAGKSGLTLAEQLRRYSSRVKIKLIDKNDYFFERKDFFSLLLGEKSRLFFYEKFSQEFQVEFLRGEVARINFGKRMIYFKEELPPLSFRNLVIAVGLVSQDLAIRGSNKEGFFYLCDVDLFRIRDYFKIASDIIVFASTFLGVKLAFFLSSFSDKEIKLLGNFEFLGDYRGRVVELLKRRKVDLYENVKIEEVIGEGMVKATKTSLPKVFSSQLVFVDSGFLPNQKLLDFVVPEERFITPYQGVYLLGEVQNYKLKEERFFLQEERRIVQEAEVLAGYLLGRCPLFLQEPSEMGVDLAVEELLKGEDEERSFSP